MCQLSLWVKQKLQNTCITEVDSKDKKTVLRYCDAEHLDGEAVSGGVV